MSESEGVFPLLDRRAPVIERIRQRNAGDEGEGLGKMTARLQSADSVAEAEAEVARFTESFTQTLADELGVEESDVSDDSVESLKDTLTNFYTEGVLDGQDPEDVFEWVDETLQQEIQNEQPSE